MKLINLQNRSYVVGGVRPTSLRCPDSKDPLNPPMCTIPEPAESETQNIMYRLLFSTLGEFALDF